MHPIRKLTRDFANDRSGSVAILFGLSCVVLMGLIGLAVDTSRYYNYASRMQQALDAAALAAAKLLPDDSVNDSDLQTTALAHFNSSMQKAGVAAVTLHTPVVTIDRTMNSVEMSGGAYLPTMFSRAMTDTAAVNVALKSKVVFDMKKVEISMVLDITGSMNSANKLTDLKAAAKDVIDELYNGSISEDGVRIALAPYSASVNAGSLAAAVTNVPATTTCSWDHHEWKCKDVAGVDQDTCVVERQGLHAATDAAPVGIDKLPNVTTDPKPGRYNCPSPTVLPLQGKSQQQEVKDTIDSYLASGATAGHIGTAWGWYLLSPEWASVLPSASAPKPYTDPNVKKSMIIMTDGEFNTSYLTGGNADTAVQTDESYAQFGALCNAIKGKNIQVFTIGFALFDARALSELEQCATTPSNFFDAKTGPDLKASFKAIVEKLNTLRVAS